MGIPTDRCCTYQRAELQGQSVADSTNPARNGDVSQSHRHVA